MKTQHLIGLIAMLSFTACEKPQPTAEAPQSTNHIIARTYMEAPPTWEEIVSKKTDVYVYNATTTIEFDTTVTEWFRYYKRMYYYPSEGFIYHSAYDTVHNISLRNGDYQIVIDNQLAISEPRPWDEVQDNDTVRWFHIHKVSLCDTLGFVLYDTFFRQEFSRQGQ